MKVQRSDYLVNPRFQLSLLAWAAALALAIAGALYGVASYSFGQIAAVAHQAGMPQNHPIFLQLAELHARLDLVFVGAALTIFILLMTWGLNLSHRIAGPMHRLHQHFVRLAQGGKLQPVKFRDDDFFQEIPEAFNRYVDQTKIR